MKRNGRAPSGAQRWRCRSCGASATHSNDVAARELAAFVGWLLSRGTQADMPGRGRTFRRRAALFWPIWPMPEVVDEAFRVVYVDGIWIARDWLPVFIALLMVLPVVWSNVCTGIRSADPALLELARVYGWPRGRVLRRIYVPSVRPHFLAALRLEGRHRRRGAHRAAQRHRPHDL